jgi:hypothetical protein
MYASVFMRALQKIPVLNVRAGTCLVEAHIKYIGSTLAEPKIIILCTARAGKAEGNIMWKCSALST